jgi:hypothetical protein
MTNPPFSRAALAQAAMEYVPPLIRRTLLDESAFNEEFGFKTEAVVSLGTSGVAIQRTELFDAVRSVLAGAENAEVVDETGSAWLLRNEADEGALPVLALSVDDERLVLPDFAMLSSDIGMRIRSFEQAAADVNLPIDAKEHWRKILTERALEDDEVDTLHRDIRNTPVHLERTIRSEIKEGQGSISSLVPSSRDYYSRLVGNYDGSASIKEYAAGLGQTFLNGLSEWRPYEGFLFSLILSSHTTLTSEIHVDRLGNDDLIKAFEFIEAHGDMLSRLGAFEVGLRVLSQRPEVEPFLMRLVHRIRDDNLEGEQCDFKLFSALFVLVDGELSRTRLMSETPPFYRRLASLAHAALIHRIIVQCGIEYKSFYEWAFSTRFEYYYMQSLADMRTEPRWNPDLIDASQIKEDFFGRLMIAGNCYSGNLGEGELRETILGNCEQSLAKLSSFFRPYYPGPLEGSEDTPNQLPEELVHAIDEQLNTDDVDASSFIALVNSAMIFRITSGHAELAAKALRLGNYTVAKLEDKSQLVGILNGLATVAAVSRSPALADDLRILVRRYLHDPQYKFSIEEAMRVCLVASASRQDIIDWRDFVGQWLTELAFSEMEKNEAEDFCSRLTTLLHSTPELWVSCARADAALKALC